MERNDTRRGFLGRLARDQRGNTIAIMAAAMFPLAGLVGGGVDMSRLYLVKTRLQQACDAGALAGRKAMGAGAWTTGANGSTEAQAKQMFAANFSQGQYGTGTLIQDYEEEDGVVTGTAIVPVPMTIMKVFGMQERSVSVDCTAKMEIPNTDVMFVLDVTASMAGARIVGLRSAVKCFYETLLRVNTSEPCTYNSITKKYDSSADPNATSSTTTAQIRLGFVPYAVNVNVGKLLPQAYLADKWKYQSREAVLNSTASVVGTSDTKKSTKWTSYQTYATYTNISSQNNCTAKVPSSHSSATGSESAASNKSYNVSGGLVSWTTTTSYNDYQYTSSYNSNTKVCTVSRRSLDKDYTKTQTYAYLKNYSYKQIEYNIQGLKKSDGKGWNDSLQFNVGTYGAAKTVAWDGCIEERHTFQNTDGNPSDDWAPVPNEALDLDIDLIPSSTTPYESYWAPMLPGLIWHRYTSTAPYTSSTDASQNMSYWCPPPARKLTEYPTANTAPPGQPTSFETYVNSFSDVDRGTYHDIGLLWGARLLSPTGIFASENAYTAAGRAIQRHLIFMTDGNAQTVYNNYTSYGLTCNDLRQLKTCPSKTTDIESRTDAIVNARLLALCSRIKNMNVTLWVISYGGSVGDDDNTRLSQCATPGRYYLASDGAALRDRFKQIASEISELRLTR